MPPDVSYAVVTSPGADVYFFSTDQLGVTTSIIPVSQFDKGVVSGTANQNGYSVKADSGGNVAVAASWAGAGSTVLAVCYLRGKVGFGVCITGQPAARVALNFYGSQGFAAAGLGPVVGPQTVRLTGAMAGGLLGGLRGGSGSSGIGLMVRSGPIRGRIANVLTPGSARP